MRMKIICAKVNLKVPLGLFVSVTGVSGSGKSTLINEILYKALAKELNRAKTRPGEYKELLGLEHLEKVIDIDQSPIGRTPRSNPATYTGVFDDIRDLFSTTSEAKIRGYKKGRFSFNVKGGRCEACRGDGIIKIEMHFFTGRLRTMRNMQREAIQSRDAGGSLQRKKHCGCFRYDDRGCL